MTRAPSQAAITSAVRAARKALRTQLALSDDQITKAFEGTGWSGIRDLAQREFCGAYRGYYPKVGMWVPSEAAIAVTFDTIAKRFGDPRRALRNVSGGDLSTTSTID